MSTESPRTDLSVPGFLSSSTSVLMSKANNLFVEIFESAMEPFGLRSKDFAVLTAIDAMGPQSQQQLARSHGIDRTTMVSVVDGLERLGLVQRSRDPDDRRKYAIALTGEGVSLLRHKLGPAMLSALDAFLTPLSPDEREQFNRLLWRLVHERDGVAAGNGRARQG
ncbi:MarR family transcriptional regulator [Microbispora corallina]|uniref:MarR family transcriptional regulator n=1 Tax=Microbispora corallina TaxID=83302 RepID=A0ABQ4FYV4_9ACTN|nr:MarR family winged helix-turn-helix transcriptional regulator [Microbispora corallina]GIH40009.1 MarR family transcriptional regulator [Microbispora corallina]